MIVIIFTFILNLHLYKDARGIKKMDNSIYLTGGFNGGYVLYEIPLKEGTLGIKLRMKMKNLSGSSLGIYVKNYGNSKSIVLPPVILKIDSTFFLWEGTDKEEWSTSRPEFLEIYQNDMTIFAKNKKMEILIYAGGGFFKRGRFIIEEIEIIEKGLEEEKLRILEKEGFTIEENYISTEVFFPYQKSLNDAQKRALALRGAKVEGERKLLKTIEELGLKTDNRIYFTDIQYIENGVKVLAKARFFF